jgi:hypothetical protein
MFQGQGSMQSTSVSHEQYAAVAGERSAPQRPKDSDVLKGTGAFNDTTQHRADYTGGVGDRYETVKRGASDVLKVGCVKTSRVSRVFYMIESYAHYHLII